MRYSHTCINAFVCILNLTQSKKIHKEGRRGLDRSKQQDLIVTTDLLNFS